MVVDARTRSRQPKGLPQHVAGTFRPEHADDDTDLAMDPVETGWMVKDRLERLAAEGETGEAERLARESGAIIAGERMPSGEGSAAYWDGRTLRTIDFHTDGRVSMRDGFDPLTVHM